jgi:hypothetical protein
LIDDVIERRRRKSRHRTEPGAAAVIRSQADSAPRVCSDLARLHNSDAVIARTQLLRAEARA